MQNTTKTINDPENAPKLLVGTGEMMQASTVHRGLCGGFNSTFASY